MANNRQRVAFVALACLQTSLFGAIILGWSSIAGTLAVAKKEDGGAGLSMPHAARLFAIASSSTMLSCLVLGFVLDRFGPRTCSVVGHLLIGSGCLIVGLSSASLQCTLGMSFIAIGGRGVTSSVFHVANLFPAKKLFLMSLFNGTTNISFCILALFDWLWEQFDVSSQTSFSWFALLALSSAVISWCSWPDKPFQESEYVCANETQHPFDTHAELADTALNLFNFGEKPLDSFLSGPSKYSLGSKQSDRNSQFALQNGQKDYVSLKNQSFWCQLRSGSYLRSLVFFVVTIFCANFYVATFAMELADENYFPKQMQHFLSRDLTYAMSWFGLLDSIFVGWLMDRLGLASCISAALVLGLLHMMVLLLLGHSGSGVLISFALYTMFRQLLVPVFLAAITARLGYTYFGVHVGLAYTICGVVQLFVGPLVQVVQGSCHRMGVTTASDKFKCDEGNWNKLHSAQLGIFILLLLIPFFDHREDQRRQRSILIANQENKLSYGSVDGI